MQFLIVAMALALSGCLHAEPRVLTQTPGSISFDCTGLVGCSDTPQQAADRAQAHCQRFGKTAQQSSMGVAPSGNFRATFNCV